MANGDTNIHTGGGASTGDVRAGGDFVGRDQINFIVPLGRWEEVCAVLFRGGDAPQDIKERFQTFDWSKAEQAYCNKVIKLYDRVRILGHSEDIPLGNIFTQVYILDKPTARQRHDIGELRKRGWERTDSQLQPGQRTQGLELVKTNRNLFILGKPGAGKTTFLKYITLQAARKQLPRIPIFVSLNQWADSLWGKGAAAALLPFIVAQFDICDFPDAALFIDYLLKQGRALVLFDGLDEVKQEQEQRRHLTRLLQDFANKYDKAQHLITCRIAASDYAFAGFADVEVADFTPEQVSEYTRNCFGDQTKKFAAFTTELAKAENQGLRDLCKTPLLLSLLCLTFDNTMRFPPNRAELYEDALETLLRKWDSSRQIQRDEIYRELSPKRKLQLLMNIAVPNFEKGELYFHQRELEKWIVEYLAKLPNAPPADTLDGTAILKAMEAQHSILVERAQGIYSFSHLTFQEYLTARYLAENHGRGVTQTLIRNHLTDQRWREVFLLTASLLDTADKFVRTMQCTINEIVADEPTLIYLLIWAQDRSQQTGADVEQQYAVRLVYILLALFRTRSLALGPAIDIHAARVAAVARPDVFSRPFANVLNQAYAFARGIDLARSNAFEFARHLADAKLPLVGFDCGLYYTWGYSTLFAHERIDRKGEDWKSAMQQLPSLVDEMIRWASDAGLTFLAQHLTVYPIPLPSTNAQTWQQYADAMFAILRDERDLGREWHFSDQDINKLNDYFYANELLVQCLKIAAVSDRQAVLNGLLLPPAEPASAA